MATTLFELEGKVSIDSSGFFTAAETIQQQISALSTAVSDLETKLSGVKISSILDSATFTAEQIVVTEGLDALATKVSDLKDTLTTVDLGGTLLSTLTGGLASLAGNLLIGDIEVGLDTPTDNEIETAITGITTKIAEYSAAIPIVLPDASTEPLSTEITTAGEGIATALEAAAAWTFPVPNMPSITSTQAKIKAFWAFVTKGLNLSVDAYVNVHTIYGEGEFGNWNSPPQTSAEFWGFGEYPYGNSNTDVQIVPPNTQIASPEDMENWASVITPGLFTMYTGGKNLTRKWNDQKNQEAENNANSPLEDAVYAALTRWATPVGSDSLAVMLTPQISEGIAQGMRGRR